MDASTPSTPTAGAPSSAAAAYAGFWRRFFAVVVDSIIVSIPANIVAGMFGAAVIVGESGVQYRPLESSLQAIFLIVYETYLIANWNGQTLGKKLLGVRVVSADGQPISIERALARSAMKLVSGFALLLGYLWMLWDARSQTWHDKVARTYVVKA
ncbi:MAG: RDD family protein [Thermomicrobiaceae bacterium]|nr:RDD family protein [Thermomicrobiaceae bacterium]